LLLKNGGCPYFLPAEKPLDNRRSAVIEMMRRELHVPVIHIDTNLINARGKVEAMSRLERWAEDELIAMNISDTGLSEALAGNNAQRTRKALTQIYTINNISPDTSDPIYQKIERALFPGGTKTQNQMNDVAIVREAAKWNAILVTNDGGSKSQPGGILGNREKIRDYVTIMTADEAAAFVRKKINERDEFNRRVVKEYGGELPEWTGKD
jgi:hypothetical protein